MSSGKRVPLVQANFVAKQFLKHIEDVPGHYLLAGSIRRKRETVGDVEIVCLPDSRVGLLARLDRLEHESIVEKAIYGGNTRWGDKLRGMVYRTMQVEVVIADSDNFGYQLWLRTGPGDKNRFVMSQMKYQRTPIRFDGGYGWHVEYIGSSYEYRKLHKLAIPDEWTLYHVLGMPEIQPWDRTELAYRRYIGRRIRPLPVEETEALYADDEVVIEPLTQLSMFD